MKSILYAGAALMIGASIYGFASYQKTSRQKGFKTMYTAEKTTAPVTATTNETSVPELKADETKQVTRAVIKRKYTKEEEMIPGVKPVPAGQQVKSENKITELDDEVSVVPAAENKIIKKKKRKFGIKEFSRAPLKEDYDDEPVKLPAGKKELKKTDIKDQYNGS